MFWNEKFNPGETSNIVFGWKLSFWKGSTNLYPIENFAESNGFVVAYFRYQRKVYGQSIFSVKGSRLKYPAAQKEKWYQNGSILHYVVLFIRCWFMFKKFGPIFSFYLKVLLPSLSVCNSLFQKKLLLNI